MQALLFLMFPALVALLGPGCDDKPEFVEEAEEAADEAAEHTGLKEERPADEARDTLEEVGQQIEEGADEVGDAVTE